SLPGFAHDDPRAGIAAWEGVVGAATNLYTRSGDPIFTALPISSGYAAFLGALSVAMALIARGRDGLGQQIEVPLYDATFTAVGYRAQRYHDLAAPDPLPQGARMEWFGEHVTKDNRW